VDSRFRGNDRSTAKKLSSAYFVIQTFNSLFFIFRRSPLFAAFIKRWGGEKKGEGEKQFAGFARTDLYTILVAAKGRAR